MVVDSEVLCCLLGHEKLSQYCIRCNSFFDAYEAVSQSITVCIPLILFGMEWNAAQRSVRAEDHLFSFVLCSCDHSSSAKRFVSFSARQCPFFLFACLLSRLFFSVQCKRKQRAETLGTLGKNVSSSFFRLLKLFGPWFYCYIETIEL